MPGVVHLNANAVFARLVAVNAAAVVIASGHSAGCHVNHQSVELERWVAMIAFAPNPGLNAETKLYLRMAVCVVFRFKETNKVLMRAGIDKRSHSGQKTHTILLL